LVDECVVSTPHIYKKTERRLKLAAKEHEFTSSDPDFGEKRALLSE